MSASICVASVVLTLVLWLLLAGAFTLDLRNLANCASYFAGLAGIVAALYFIYLAALVLILGGEFNRALRIRRLARALSTRAERARPREKRGRTGGRRAAPATAPLSAPR